MDTLVKRCSTCLVEFPATHEYFYRYTRSSDGLNAACKKCMSARNKKWKEKHPNYSREYSREYRAKHPDRCKAYEKKYKESHAEEYRERHRQYYHVNKQQRKQRAREYYIANRERILSNNRQWALSKKYWRTVSHRRRAKIARLPNTFTPKHWNMALEYFKDRCAVCGRPQGFWHILAQDHWIPLSSPECPGTTPTNIVPLCHGVDGCNNSKGFQSPRGWLISKLGKRLAEQKLNEINAYFEWINRQSE